MASDREQALSVLMVHASFDPAWCCEMTPEQAEVVFRDWLEGGGK